MSTDKRLKEIMQIILISTVKFNLVNLSVKKDDPLERWKRGLSMILEKVPGNFTVENCMHYYC